MSLKRRIKNVEERVYGRSDEALGTRLPMIYVQLPPDCTRSAEAPGEVQRRPAPDAERRAWPAAIYAAFLGSLDIGRDAEGRRLRVFRPEVLLAVAQRWIAAHPQDRWLLDDDAFRVLLAGLDPALPADPELARGPLFDPYFEEQP